MNRVVLNMDEQGGFVVYSDEPIEFYTVCDFAPNDRVYQGQVEVGVEKVRSQLRNDPIGHMNDDHVLGNGYGPRKPASKRKLEIVK